MAQIQNFNPDEFIYNPILKMGVILQTYCPPTCQFIPSLFQQVLQFHDIIENRKNTKRLHTTQEDITRLMIKIQ